VAPGVPRAAWLREPSELGFAAGLVPRPAEPDRVGLFTVLIQRHGRTTRVLRGRYLWVRAQFAGDGRTTPELLAVRAYASRFSYSRRYLPALYHEPDPEADEPGEAGGADFLERFLALFESVLTPLEDRIADAHRLVDPRTCPAGALDWLASFRASPAPAGLPDARRRRLLAHDGELARAEGTLAGFTRHLDLAGDGALARGEVVVVEDFRLRRTLATILGVDLADETDPLLSGLVASGNSIVGDALILGEPIAAEIAALFEDHDAEAAEDDAAATFFDRYAHRVTVLVSATLPDAEIGFIRDAARRAVPAHVQLRIIDAEPHLVVGVASLLGIDTRLGPSPAPSTAEVGRSRLAGGDRLGGEGRLDGRTGESPPAGAPPVARADDVFVPTGADIVLDASGSTAAPGRRLGRFAWRLAPEGEA
jgi:phage tail-like protein